MPRDDFQSEFCAAKLRAIGDPHRLRIISALRSGELTVSDLAHILDLEVVTVSHHLKILRQSELIEGRREGRFVYYRIRENLFRQDNSSSSVLNLGCCRIEFPDSSKT